MKRKVFISIVIATFLVTAALIAGHNPANGGGSNTGYQTAQVSRGDLISSVSATGSLKAVLQVKVGSQLSGQIAELLVDFNDSVVAGQAIAKLDSRTYEARMREALANLKVAQAKVSLQQAAIVVVQERIVSAEARHDEAKRTFSRREALQKKGTLSQANLDEARATLDSTSALLRAERSQLKVKEAELTDAIALVERQEALLSQAEIELSRTIIRAPIDGVIVGRDVEEGQTVAASLEAPTLFEIAQDLSSMEIHVRVDEADIGVVRLGQSVEFTVDAFPTRAFFGRVAQVRQSPETEENVVTYTVVASAANADSLLLPGMTANVQINVLEKHDVARVPDAALRFQPRDYESTTDLEHAADLNESKGGRRALVWVPDESGNPSPVYIRVGDTNGSESELITGALDVGDHVMVGNPTGTRKARSVLGIRFGF